MRLRISGRFLAALTGVLCVASLAGCGSISKLTGGSQDSAPSSSRSGDDSFTKTFLSGGGTTGPDVDPSIFASQVACPPIEVRADTYLLAVYERGKEDDPQALKYQGSIRKYARECDRLPNGELAIKVGVSGRVVAGPVPTKGPVVLPVRIAVTGADNKVLVSQLVLIEVGLAESDGSVGWARVVDDIRVPAEGASRVYVGFDNKSSKR